MPFNWGPKGDDYEMVPLLSSNNKRILDRDNHFHQSYGRYNVKHISKNSNSFNKLFINDWYNSILNLPTWKVLLLTFAINNIVWLFFAGTYYYIEHILIKLE